MLRHLLSIQLLLMSCALAQDIRATTSDGRAVLLKPDGTWTFESDSLVIPTSSEEFTTPSSATSVASTKIAAFKLTFDGNEWEPTPSDDPTKVTINHASGEIFAVLIAERGQMSVESLRRIALTNARKASQSARAVFQEYRRVNGSTVLCLQMAAEIQGTEFTFLGYYYSDKRGSIQVLTYTYGNLFEEHRSTMTRFLNGFTVSPE